MFIFDWHLARGFLDADDDDETMEYFRNAVMTGALCQIFR